MRQDKFAKFFRKSALVMGSPLTFATAVGLTIAWVIKGLFTGFNADWHLMLSTIGTVTTGLCVFLVQNTQNRDARAMQLKLDEIIRSNTDARNSVIALEEKADDVVEELQKELRDSD